MRTPRRPRLYFSFRSPYSWMAVHRLRTAVPEVMRELDWLPYFDPDPITEAALAERDAEFHYVQMSRAKHRYILMDTKRLADRDGLTMAWPVDVDPWWELPHLAWLAARRAGRAEPMYDAIVDARWRRGDDICTPAVIRAAAIEAGVDPDVAAGAADDPEIRDEATAGLVRAYHDDVFGVPFLRLGPHRFWGLERIGAFLEAWRGVAPPPAAAAAVTTGYDTDSAGGCG
jgi:2-hydroxychromene-2-carboxylate isomerase